MTKVVFQSSFQALPPYFGGKRKLIPWIFSHLAQAIPPHQWQDLTFIDAFMGGGSISLFAKAQGFKNILTNDWSFRSQLIGRALLENQATTLNREDVLKLTCPFPVEEKGFITETFSPSVLSRRHAEALDCGFYWAHQTQDPTKQALQILLLWHILLSYVCFSTSIGTSNRPFAECLDGLRNWDSLNPKRFQDGSLTALLKPTWHLLESKRKTINRGVFGGTCVQLFQQDALTFIQQVQGDILYLDPPYPGTLSYENSNRVLDSILSGKPLSAPSPPSSFSKSPEALETLLDASQHIPTWLLSYGNKTCTLEDLIHLVQRHAAGRKVIGFSKTYAHMPHVSSPNRSNEEYLVLAIPQKGGHYYA